ncbi:uncharacterized protein LOC115759113 [Drosophila novamexicana]|uniref:uncharacterized protein LOC115759113 n=1 Tax=Drosophila novamexicana TaxID=47314 RepID=UPI0011E592D8|nr:uncharacterized protein LOC115759113 [Drosophila novamexicana]
MQNENRRNSYDVISIPSYESIPVKSESSHPSQDAVRVTSQMVFNLKCNADGNVPLPFLPFNAPTPPVSEAGDTDFLDSDPLSKDTLAFNVSDIEASIEVFCPQLMIIYGQGDINCALYFLIDSLHRPFQSNAVVTVLVEESMRDELVERILAQMRPLCEREATHSSYRASVKALQDLHLDVITASEKQVPPPLATPIVVCNGRHSLLGFGPTGVICLHTFRTTNEIIDICRKDNVNFESVNIWNESVEGLYQLVVNLDCSNFFFNCCNVNLGPIIPSHAVNKIDVHIVDRFHYETLQVNEKKKIIVFPIGEHLAQRSTEDRRISLAPIVFLNE